MRWVFVAFAGALLPALTAGAQDLVAQRTLRVGAVIQPGDVRALSKGPDADAALSGVIGMELRRSLYTGQPVLMADLGPPTLIDRNDVVVMTYTAGALGIRTEGRALASGGEGELIQVMNLTSRLIVRAVVRGPRQVEVVR